MKMVVTLRNGIQIASDVEEFSTGRSPIEQTLTKLTWTGTGNGTTLRYVSLSDVIAIHSIYENGDEAAVAKPEGEREAS